MGTTPLCSSIWLGRRLSEIPGTAAALAGRRPTWSERVRQQARKAKGHSCSSPRTHAPFILAENGTTLANAAASSAPEHYSECSPLKITTGALSGDPESLKKHGGLAHACVAAPSLPGLSGPEQLALKPNSRFKKNHAVPHGSTCQCQSKGSTSNNNL